MTLSPLVYHYQHWTEVEAVVQAGTGRDLPSDVLTAGVGTVLAADPRWEGSATGPREAPRPVDFANRWRR